MTIYLLIKPPDWRENKTSSLEIVYNITVKNAFISQSTLQIILQVLLLYRYYYYTITKSSQ
jgi:hypothetical protein